MIHEIFDRQAGLNSLRTAVDDGRPTTYEQLARQTDDLHTLLRSAGVGKDTIVVVALPLSTALMVSMLSIFKANGIYLPGDILKFSPRRQNQIFTEAFHGYVIAEAAQTAAIEALLRQAGTEECRLFVPQQDGSFKIRDYDSAANSFRDAAALPVKSNGHQASAEDSCYIYYTSGSTGEGKAIVGCHASLEHYISWAISEFKIGPGDRVAHLSQTTFDASLKDSLMALCSGATLVLPSPATKENTNSLCRWIDDNNISIFQTVPSLFRLMLRSLSGRVRDKLGFDALRIIFLDGEPLLAKDVSEWRTVGNEQTELVNMYGTTETTILDTFHRITAIPQDPGQIIHVGKPIDKTFILILNQRNQLCRIGEAGEVYIKSAYLTKGYYNNPTLTKEVFVQNPLVSGKTDIVYKTGDLGRYLPDRSVEILGRKDRQLKINGVRLEPGEIERAVLRTGMANEVVIKDVKGANQQTYLICYYTPRGAVLPSELKKALQQELNQNLIPSFLVPQEQFPININGKVDKHALPLPADIIHAMNYEPVQGTAEEQLETIWKDILEVDRIGRKTSFFAIGGHSLKTMQLITRVQQELEVELNMQEVFDHPTIEEMAALLQSKEAAGYAGIPRYTGNTEHPLAYAQQRLWFIHQLEGEQGLTYNIASAVKIGGAVNPELFRQSLNVLTDRHENLRASFQFVNGRPVQRIGESRPARVKILQPGKVYNEEELQEIVRGEAAVPFDLSTPPLLRLTLIEQGDATVLVLVMHHIITDNWSMNILAREFFTVYRSLETGVDPRLPFLPIRYTDYVQWQHHQFESGAWDAQALYWKKELEGMPAVLQLPLKQRRPAVQTYNGALHRFLLQAKEVALLKTFCAAEECTLFMALMAAFATLLAKYSGQSEVVIGYPIANRHRKELEPLVGFFANTLVMCLEMAPGLSFRRLVQLIKRKTIDASNNQDYPFEKLVERLNPKRNLSYAPLFQVMLSVQHEQRREGLSGFDLTTLRLAQTAGAKFDLNLVADADGDGLHLAFEYNTELFDAPMIHRMSAHLKGIIEAMIRQPEQLLNQLSIVTETERELAASWNRVHVPDAVCKSVPELFERCVREHPHDVALIWDKEELTFHELNQRADQLADYFKKQGLPPGIPVGICLERSATLVAALLGILKAGGAFLPLDPTQPAARLQYLLSDSGVQVVLTEEKWTAKLSTLLWYNRERIVLAVDTALPLLHLSVLKRPAGFLHKDQPAYIVYASVSDRKPKSVMTDGAALLNRLRWMQEAFPLEKKDKVLQKTPFVCDTAIREILWPLTAGAQLVIAPSPENEAPSHLAEVIDRFGITTLHFTPSRLEMFLAELSEGRCNNIRRVFCSGEILGRALQNRFFEKLNAELINLYGFAEAPLVSYWQCNSNEQRDPLPIGRPIGNLHPEILDAEGLPVPFGVTGNIYVKGPGLAPVSPTGDLGRYTPDGLIEFCGRAEDRLKKKGVRIEPLDIEKALLSHPVLRHAAVLSKTYGQEGEPSVVAFYSTANEKSLSESGLRDYLLKSMPEFMVPDRFSFLKEWPLTQEGKTDRSALLAMDVKPPAPQPAYAAPLTPTERDLAELWRTLLMVEKPGIDDDFFELGGHSLLALEVLDKVQERFNIKLSVTQFFEQNTIRKTALVVDKFIQLRREMDFSEEEGSEIIRI